MAYKTINSDSARYNERIAQLEARPKRAVAEVAPVAEAAAVVETTAAEVVNAEAEQTSEPVDATLEVEAATAIVEAVAADAEEPTAPVVEDVAAEAASPIAETTVIPMSDLLSTVKILAGSTAEIAAASVGDQHLVAAVRLAEENNSVETLNGLEVVDVKAEISAPEEAVVEEVVIGRSDLKTEEELKELASGVHAVEEFTIVVDDQVKSESDSAIVHEVYVESLASSEKVENILELEESTSPVVMLSEDDTISGAAEVMSDTVETLGQKMEDDEKAMCHEPPATETEHADLTSLPDLEESLQATDATETAEVVVETMQDAVEEAKPVEVSDEAAESGNVTMPMAQA
ncbi:MGARP-like isoform X2 [Labeo rohita]|uniref:MGARP-like isoform X2 n=1 Tax=Labeo rohita TaxID=84645 RepID=A0A498MFE9_LABRO|nr:MGARP-like isoform X2 [Labeo rohita]